MYNQNKSRVFVTGASGFVGANIIRHLLKNNFDVHILYRSKQLSWRLKAIADSITIHNGDITNIKSLKDVINKVIPDYIIHLAAYGAYHYQDELDKIVKVNIEGTSNLLEATKEIPYKCFINTGSSSEYGFKNTPMKEADACDPVSYYGVTKLAQTQMCRVFAKLNNKPIITLRLFSVYGQFEEPGRFIPTIIKSLIKNETIKITPGNQRRDFIYVDDVAKAYINALSVDKKYYGDIFNIGTGKECTNDEIVNRLFSAIQKKTFVQKGAYPKRSWDATHWVADTSKTEHVLQWKPEYTIKQGLTETYNWLANNITYYP